MTSSRRLSGDEGCYSSSLDSTLSVPGKRMVLNWDIDGRDWPNRNDSRFVDAGGINWHVQISGQGPKILLLHGTGASSHSWRDLVPLLAEHHTVLTLDLPGHGFTQTPSVDGLSLTGMASLLGSLMEALDYRPVVVAGHSAGAAVAAQMCLDGTISPQWLVSINGAWLPFSGLAGRLFSPLARFLAQKRIWASLFAHRASDRRVVERLLAKTGSVIDSRGIDLYTKLVRDTEHNAAALGMMANWDLNPLLARLEKLHAKLLLVVGENDQMVPPHQAQWLKARLPSAQIHKVPGFGHLLHEEQPVETAELILQLAREIHESRQE